MEAPTTSDKATTGRTATFGADGYWNKAATRNTTKANAAAQQKAKKDQPTPIEDAYPRLKKLKPTDLDTEAVNNKLTNLASASPRARLQDCKSQGISQGPGKHNLKLAKLRLQNERQMAQDKIKGEQQSAWYKGIQPAGIHSANRAVSMGGASKQPWPSPPIRLRLSPPFISGAPPPLRFLLALPYFLVPFHVRMPRLLFPLRISFPRNSALNCFLKDDYIPFCPYNCKHLVDSGAPEAKLLWWARPSKPPEDAPLGTETLGIMAACIPLHLQHLDKNNHEPYPHIEFQHMQVGRAMGGGGQAGGNANMKQT
ncbi:hypothetical protein BDK51DRAFT_33782 [Blyttiomyces helicus]|uniref:Uncharacterized protein n=1 Tax=Blyttiomyces helicus TaxID=388810 RepID=A0A4P9WK91_9FUNG|nr:hypothetical protein BDK51DRAFT_33782 [Blyttiomyces helicus]|eukprot:RKO92525.1 hypothetical protein BDK51DRAFT_33782 [Blyttiomyces helicus]